MLELKDIRKQYGEGDSVVHALDGVSLKFRENEFVSILGASGCGKTTMLNIIGGLDRYTSGDLIIGGRSTKNFTDSDWDTYRNHSIGFVFQSYNLIPHQTVLSNVELALTLSGISKTERRQRAVEALNKVGLGDQLHKKPNQMSGGQMQRVAIARALVNNPDILLADEPTGALDTNTSVQIMDLLREVAKEKLVIMVTHNPDLAEQYSTRIVKLSDGRVISDTNPFDGDLNEQVQQTATTEKTAKKQTKKKTMSFPTALSLSFNNLLTKKARTILTSFAGSIGIIGIALILSLSNGIQAYIDQVQEDTLSTYPLTISKETQDITAMMTAMTQVSEMKGEIDPNKIYVDDSMGTMMSAMSSTVSNNLEAFKKYLDEHYDEIKDSVSDIQYTYDFDLQVFTADGKTQVNPTTIFDSMGESFSSLGSLMDASGMGGMGVMSEMINNQALLDQQYELVGENSRWPTSPNEVVLVISKDNQISKMTLYMLGVLDQGEIEQIMKDLMTDGTYDTTPMEPYDLNDFIGMKFLLLNTSDFYEKTDEKYPDNENYHIWKDVRDDVLNYDQSTFVTENGTELVISGIIRPRDGVTATSISGAIGYTKGLTDMILEMNTQSEVINQQKLTPDINVLTGRPFEKKVYTKENINELIRTIDSATMQSIYAAMTEQVKDIYTKNPPVTNAETFMAFVSFMSDEELSILLEQMFAVADSNKLPMVFMALSSQLPAESPFVIDSKEDLLTVLPLLDTKQKMTVVGALMSITSEEALSGIYQAMNAVIMEMEVDENTFLILLQMMDDEQFATTQDMLYKVAPQTDATYDSTLKRLGDAEKASPASINFYAKDFESKDNIESFIKNYNNTRENEVDKLQYTDIIGVMMSSVSLIINVISYVLIAFVSISLVVSSIMIGIITYISVLERTKEIGILRSIGASKKDISRVFNAETLIVGLAAGVIGIVSTIILCLPINAIIHLLSGNYSINAVLPWVGGVALIVISMVLTLVAGLIPSKIAAKKDPVEALRTE